MNCSAPDTGNMEVLERVGTPEQKAQWLKPLLAGEIRSAYAMTEVHHASSDARNIATSARLEGNEYVINGEKHYISGAGSPRCKILITMVRTNPDAPSHQQQSMILVPKDTPGVKIIGAMHVFGEDHAPHGHMHIVFDNVRVPKDNILLGEGRGFEISQVRLGPGRIHHCMRSIGQAEKALDLMVQRGVSREAFGRKLAWLGGNVEHISRARIDIEAMRLMVLKAAKAMDVLGNREARIWVHMVKATGARARVPDHRPGHPDARRLGRVAAHPAGAHVRDAAHPAPGRRARRGAPPGGGPAGDRPPPEPGRGDQLRDGVENLRLHA